MLDLHNLNYEDAERETIRFIESNWLSERDLKIITGNSNSMKSVVINILTEYELSYSIGNGIDLNTGYIVVKINL